MLQKIESFIQILSSIAWPAFVPFLLLVGAYICVQVMMNTRYLTAHSYKTSVKYVLPRAAISIATIMGTGTIVGFLGALNKLSASGEIYVESIAIWALVGALILVPISYCETLIAKIVNMSPKDYIGVFLSKRAAKLYIISLILLYIFAIGGVQISGIDAIITTSIDFNKGIKLLEIQRYIYVVIPIIAILTIIVFNNKRDIFMRIVIGMILAFFIAYFVFFAIFVYKTYDYIPLFINKMIIGIKNPVSMLFGIPLGLIFGIQRIIQIAEPGLGTLALSAMKSDSDPKLSATISLVMTSFLAITSIVVTSYIASFGISKGFINFSDKGIYSISRYFDTVGNVTGKLGVSILFIFIILSAITTLISGYLILERLLNSRIITLKFIYVLLLMLGGALSIYRVDLMTNILELLILIVTLLNITALVVFVEFECNKYSKKGNIIQKVV